MTEDWQEKLIPVLLADFVKFFYRYLGRILSTGRLSFFLSLRIRYARSCTPYILKESKIHLCHPK